MLYIMVFLIGVFVGLVIISCISINNMNNTEEELHLRAQMIVDMDRDMSIQREMLSAIRQEVNAQQYGSVTNLQNKIKSILSDG